MSLLLYRCHKHNNNQCHCCCTGVINTIITSVIAVAAMDTATELRCKLQHLIRDAQHKLRTSDNEKELQLMLQCIAALLPGGKWQPTLPAISEDKLHDASREFMDRHYVHFAELLLSKLTADWLGKLPKGQTECLFDVFFLHGAPVDSFTLLCGALTGTRSLLSRLLTLIKIRLNY